ncbi:ferric-chelate reductase 1-like [Ciona intestinalis]
MMIRLVSILVLICSCYGQSSPAHNDQDNIAKLASGDGWLWNTTTDCSPACRTITWEKTVRGGNDALKFTVSGPNLGYVAVAISTDEGMGPADDTYICTTASSTVVVHSGYLTAEIPPGITATLATSDVTSSITNGVITCSFYRPMSVTKSVAGSDVTWNVNNQNFNVLYAEGAIDANRSIHYHSLRKHTHGAFNLLKPKGSGAATVHVNYMIMLVVVVTMLCTTLM